jgi:hypothetical protein
LTTDTGGDTVDSSGFSHPLPTPKEANMGKGDYVFLTTDPRQDPGEIVAVEAGVSRTVYFVRWIGNGRTWMYTGDQLTPCTVAVAS